MPRRRSPGFPSATLRHKMVRVNDDDPAQLLAAMRADHRRLDENIRRAEGAGNADLFDLARLKKAKLRLKDEIAALADATTPDIIA